MGRGEGAEEGRGGASWGGAVGVLLILFILLMSDVRKR